jgi:hypothetical protein
MVSRDARGCPDHTGPGHHTRGLAPACPGPCGVKRNRRERHCPHDADEYRISQLRDHPVIAIHFFGLSDSCPRAPQLYVAGCVCVEVEHYQDRLPGVGSSATPVPCFSLREHLTNDTRCIARVETFQIVCERQRTQYAYQLTISGAIIGWHAARAASAAPRVPDTRDTAIRLVRAVCGSSRARRGLRAACASVRPARP